MWRSGQLFGHMEVVGVVENHMLQRVRGTWDHSARGLSSSRAHAMGDMGLPLTCRQVANSTALLDVSLVVVTR